LMKPAPLVIICPGGGYEFLSNREAEQFALQWNARGIHAAVLRYSIAPARYPVALLQLAKTVLLVREKSKEWGVNQEQIFLEGSSAGGHLAACYGAFWKKKDLRQNTFSLLICFATLRISKVSFCCAKRKINHEICLCGDN